MKRPRKNLIIVAVALLVVAGGFGYYWVHKRAATPSDAKSGRKVLYWHDPMVPGYKSDKPGKSPFMDMELVPVYADEAGAPPATDGRPVVSVAPEVLNNLGVRTHVVTREARTRQLTTHGYLFRAGSSAAMHVLVDILDREVDWVRPGLSAEVRLTSLSGQTLAASVESIQSDIDVGARSLKARIRLNAADPRMRPNMFAEVTIHSTPQSARLAIPSEALIRTGTRTAVVLALGAGRFQPVDVVPGAESGDWVEIRSGLKEGDTVVVSGQFLIDSESSLRASFTRMGGNGADAKPADHDKH
jgi:Cu(I)/Ag(I) efflux system membrane fusion protein